MAVPTDTVTVMAVPTDTTVESAPLMPLPRLMLNPDTVTDTVTVMAVPTDTVTVMAVPTDTTVESAPLMPNPKPRLPLMPLPRLMPLLDTVTVTMVMVDITDTPTVTDTVIIGARGLLKLMPNPDMVTTVMVDTTVAPMVTVVMVIPTMVKLSISGSSHSKNL